ncbi:MAG: rane fusion protein multidrug efflux system, partial [Acidobacteriaceae bacterium]|nr:rane fusion protein multidrug efflux system [Acidobacteriaceae bacterium]
MSAQQTEFKETNFTSVATAKPELPHGNQTEQGIRRIFNEHPGGARAAALLLLAVVIVGGGIFLWNSLAWESTDDAQVNGHIMPLSARINGYVLEVPVIEGQLVHAGDVLVTIDPKDYKIA